MVQRAAARHPHLTFIQADVQDLDLGTTFDVIVCSDLINDLWDVEAAFEVIARHSHSFTRLVLNSYSNLWQIPRMIAETLGMARPMMPQNWLTVEDTRNLLYLAGFESIRRSSEIMLPVRIRCSRNWRTVTWFGFGRSGSSASQISWWPVQ